jgi:signal transduction histidine kinase
MLVVVAAAAWVEALAGGSLGTGVVGTLAVAATAFLAGRVGTVVPLLTAGPAAVALLALADQAAAPGQFSAANDGVFYAVLVGGPLVAGRLLGDRARQLVALRAGNAELERRRPAVVEAARAEEAARVEDRVDRALAERLDVVVAGIRSAGQDPERLASVEATAREALEELRELLGALAPAVPDLPGCGAKTVPVRRPDRVDLVLALAGLPLAVESGDVLVSLAQGALLPVVRRHRVLGCAALMVTAALQSQLLTPVPPLVSWLVPGLLAAYLTGHGARRGASLAGLVTALAGVALITVATPADARELGSLGPSTVMGLLAWWGGRVVTAREERAAGLAALTERLEHAERAEARLAAAEQRAELARELHDVGAHALTVVCLQAGAGQRVRDPEQRARVTATLGELADGTLTALRRSLRGLAETGESLESLAELGRALGLRVELTVVGEPRSLPADVARAAHRVVQESLTNAARHAPRGTVRVSMRHSPSAVEVTVSDDGPGAGPVDVPVHGAGLGLLGMRQRVESLRGELTYGRAGSGFEVRARLPVPA